MADKRVPIPYPAKGISENYGFSYQEELTCRDERNMRVRDPRTGRLRGAQRGGMSLWGESDAQANGTNKVSAMGQVSSALSQIAYASEFDDPIERWTNATQNEDGVCVAMETDGYGNYYSVYDNGVVLVHNTDGALLHTITIPAELLVRNRFISDMSVDRYQNVWIAIASTYDQGGNLDEAAPCVGFIKQLDGEYVLQYTAELIREFPTTVPGFDAYDRNAMAIGVCSTVSDADVDELWVMFALYPQGPPDGSYTSSGLYTESSMVFLMRYPDYPSNSPGVLDNPEPAKVWMPTNSPALPDTIPAVKDGGGFPFASDAGRSFGMVVWPSIYAVTGQLRIGEDNAVLGVFTCWDSSARIEYSETFAVKWADASGGLAAQMGRCGSSRYGVNLFTSYQSLDFATQVETDALVADTNATGIAVSWSGQDNQLVTLGDPVISRQHLFDFVAEPGIGDKLILYGPDENGVDQTYTITYASGTTLTMGGSAASIGVGLFSSAAEARHVTVAVQTHARAGTAAAKFSQPSSNYIGPDIWLSGGLADSSDAALYATHPKPDEALDATEAYWKVEHNTNVWSNASSVGTNNAFDAPVIANLRRMKADSVTSSEALLQQWNKDLEAAFVTGATTVTNRKRYINTDDQFRYYIPFSLTSTNAAYSDKGLLVREDDDGSSAFKAFDAANPSPCIAACPQTAVPAYAEELGHSVLAVLGGARDTGLTGNPSVFAYRLVSTTQSALAPRTVHTIATSGSKVLKVSGSGIVEPHNNAVIDSLAPYVQMAPGFEEIFIADGATYWRYDPLETGNSANGEVAELLCTSEGEIPPRCRLIETWRDRVVLARDPADPGRWHMSAIGDPNNWDFFPLIDTSSKAVTATATLAGRVPDVVNAVCPWTEDFLIFGGDRSLWRLTGDPAAGGVLDLISDETGMSFGRPYCKDPEGGLWFFGSNGGLYYMTAGTFVPTRVSLGRVEAQLRSVDLGNYYIQLQWNPIDEGVHIFQLPFGAGGAIVDHWFYEVPTGSWHKDRFGALATDLIQPTASLRIDGDLPQDRTTLVGCEDGRFRVLPTGATTARKSDQKTASTDLAIDSYVLMGPLVSNPTDSAQQVTEFAAVLSSSGDGCNYEFFASDNPEDLGNPVSSGSLKPGRNDRRLVRVANDHVYLRLRNASKGQCWAYEGASVLASYGGEVRR